MFEMNTTEFYNEEAKIYDRDRWTTKAGVAMDKIHKEIVTHALKQYKPGPIVEIATGTGRFSVELCRNGFDTVATDISEKMIQVAKEKVIQYGIEHELHLFVAKATNLPFKDNSFRAGIMINAASHISVLEEVLDDVSRIIVPNGGFIINFPNVISPYFAFGLYVSLRRKAVLKDVYTKWYTLNEIKKLLQDAGFEIAQIWGHFNYPTWINSKPILTVLTRLDHVVRNSLLRRFAPTIYVCAVVKPRNSNLKSREHFINTIYEHFKVGKKGNIEKQHLFK